MLDSEWKFIGFEFELGVRSFREFRKLRRNWEVRS